MTLLEARFDFTRCVGRLLALADSQGFSTVLDEAKRGPIQARWNADHCRVLVGGKRCEKAATDEIHLHNGHAFKAIGISDSCHGYGLAVDLLLFSGGAISNDRLHYAVLGNYWKTLHPLARWGGDFKGFPDLGHYSFEWQRHQ